MTRPALRRADGFSMVVVIMVMMVTSLFVTGALAAAQGDLPFARDGQDRKSAYAAAEAGLNYYLFQLAQNPDYWLQCDQVSPPSSGEPNPVNLAWSGTGSDPRRFRTVPGSTARYAIELLPAPGRTACVPGDQNSAIDPSSGTLRLRVTGEARAGSPIRRTIAVSLRRKSFLDYIYFTTYETLDPVAYDDPAWANANCADRYRSVRNAGCVAIRFISADQINGPFHTEDDDVLTCGTPTFGRGPQDAMEVGGTVAAYTPVCGAATPVFSSPPQLGKRGLQMPTTNAELAQEAQPAYTFTGTTTVRLNGTTMTVTNGGSTTTKAMPSNGVVYVKTGAGCSGTTPPRRANYTETAGCAQLYVSGSTSKSLTLGSENDIIIRPPAGSSNGDLLRTGDALVGLIANNFVRIYHKVNRTTDTGSVNGCTNVDTTSEPLMRDVRIDAAILSLQHSFIVDNYGCGPELGTLTVNGAIAQKYRGPVGTTNGSGTRTGFVKSYTYDDRLRYRNPPHFLEPVSAAWKVTRRNEQVPAIGAG